MAKFPSTGFSFCLITALCVAVAPLSAQTCSGAGDLTGSYGMIATKLVLGSQPATPPGTSGGTVILPPIGATPPGTSSNTGIGRLVAGVAADNPFGLSGRIFADGAGNLFASAANDGTAQVQVGSYTVNTDCTVSVTVTDNFIPPQPPPSALAPGSATFEGILLNRGATVELITGESGSATRLTLVRTGAPQSCSAGDLTGAYTLAADGVGFASSTPASVSIIARAVADGNGSFVVDPPSVSSPLKARTLTGTYTVNTDCTGTAKFVDANKNSLNVSFVLVDPASLAGSPPNQSHKTLKFVFTNEGLTGSGALE